MMQRKIADGQNQTKKLLNMKLRHVEITVIKQQPEFRYFIDIEFRDLNFRVFYISQVLHFAIF